MLRLIPEAGPSERNLKSGRPLEAKLVAAAIRRIIAQGWPITDPDTKAVRPARWGDVAVLYRSSNVLDPIEREFRRQGVPYRVIGGKSFFEREEIVRLISVLTAIEQPGDALSVVAALRSSFFGVSDVDLAASALLAGSRFDYRDDMPEDLPDSVREAFTCLRELHVLRGTVAPAALVATLYERTKVLAVHAQAGNGEQAVANLLKVLDEARRLEREGPIPFRRLTEHLLALRQDGGEESEATLEDLGGARAHLLTIHKAKGLEFPVVILIDLAASMDASGASRNPHLISVRRDPHGAPSFALNLNFPLDDAPLCTARWHELKALDDERERAEAIRLLYVALTRARDYLILPKVVAKTTENRNHKPKTWQDIIEGVPASALWTEWKLTTQGKLSLGASDARPALAGDVDALRAERDELVRRRDQRKATGGKLRVQVRRPSLHEAERGTVDEETPPVGVESASQERDLARRLGTVIHAALERLKPGEEAQITELVDLLAPEHGLNAESREAAIRQTGLGLSAEVVRRGGSAPRSWKEVPVTICQDDEKGITTLTRGICDLVFEQDGGVVLVDYKTDRGTPDDVPRLVKQYRDQLREYVRALSTATGRPVVEAWLVFLGLGDEAHQERVEV